MGMVSSGEVDAAAVDSNVMRIALSSDPELRERLRVIESWGPFPVQPVVLRSGLDPALKEGVRTALLSIGAGSRIAPALAGYGLERFAPVTYEHYAPEERVLRECESVLGATPRRRQVRGSLDQARRQPPGE